jgi:hypothetical protein
MDLGLTAENRIQESRYQGKTKRLPEDDRAGVLLESQVFYVSRP